MMDKVHSLASSEERKAIISDGVTRIGATTCKALNLADSHKAFLISKYCHLYMPYYTHNHFY